jgi:hypothetical protein
VIPADRKWYARWAIARVVRETLEAIKPEFPEASGEFVGVRVE